MTIAVKVALLWISAYKTVVGVNRLVGPGPLGHFREKMEASVRFGQNLEIGDEDVVVDRTTAGQGHDVLIFPALGHVFSGDGNAVDEVISTYLGAVKIFGPKRKLSPELALLEDLDVSGRDQLIAQPG